MTIAQANKALRLIAAKGRAVTFIKLNETVSDAAKPWRGNVDPRDTPEASLSTSAVFVPPSSASALGLSRRLDEEVKRLEQIAIVSTGGADQTNLAEMDEIIDTDLSRWKIMFVEVLQPASVKILYFVGLER